MGHGPIGIELGPVECCPESVGTSGGRIETQGASRVRPLGLDTRPWALLGRRFLILIRGVWGTDPLGV